MFSLGRRAPHQMHAMHFGPREVLTLSLEFDDDLTAAAVEEPVSGIERRIRSATLRFRAYSSKRKASSHTGTEPVPN